MYTITGKFQDAQSGEAISYEIIDFDNGMQVVTNSLGYYSLDVEPCWSDTLRPVSDNYNFDPEYRVYTQVTEDYNNQDYLAYEISTQPPPGWEYVNTGYVHIISVKASIIPNLCGIPLEPGDWIGVFYIGDDGEYHCGGAEIWLGDENIPVVAQGNDPYTPEKDGFSYGEMFNWIVYKPYTDEKEFIAVPVYDSCLGCTTSNKFSGGQSPALSILDELNVFYNHKIEIPNGWSGISSHLIPNVYPITTLMSPIIENLVLIQTLTKMYYPSAGINTIGFWNSHQGYKIKVSEATTLPLLGCPDANKTLNFTTTWNIFPVLSSCNVQTSDIFGSVTDDLVVIKEIGGVNIYWPAMGIYTLSVLEPGKAYMAAVTSNVSITFPDCTGMKSAVESNAAFVNESPWEMPEFTASTHTIALKGEGLSGFSAGDYVGAFTADGTCAGITMIGQPGQSVALNVFGDDISTAAIEGFTEGEPMLFRVYYQQSGEISDAEAIFDPALPASGGLFADNGISAISNLKATATGISGGAGQQVTLYPNPSDGNVTFDAGSFECEVTITDIKGQELFRRFLTGKQQLDLSGFEKGVYFVRISGAEFSNTKKLILK
ncbi:MAG: T9SS type A sorting domain-containing protein [Bacteroidales bacterium]